MATITNAIPVGNLPYGQMKNRKNHLSVGVRRIKINLDKNGKKPLKNFREL